VTSPVTGSVTPTLALTLSPAATLGPFIPGIAREYETSVAATVTSSAGDAALSVSDPNATAPGRLVNGAFALTAPVQAKATNTANPSTVFAPVSATPLTLLTYSGPASLDQVTIGIKQAIGANEGLRTGTYAKTLTFTLSTTTP
jgi:hypothetical protein